MRLAGLGRSRQEGPRPQLGEPWKRNGLAIPKYEINGVGARNNPLRRPLKAPFTGEQLFFRYRIRYDASSLDAPPAGDGEFVVFWLDDQEGANGSTHSGGVPNVGIHVADDGNRFMARYSPASQRFGAKLAGDRDYLVVGRLWKSKAGAQQPFDRLDFWIDPKASEVGSPHASTRSAKSIRRVAWIGFSTGVKTEVEDRITVWDVEVADSWRTILGLPTDVPPVKIGRADRSFPPRCLADLAQTLF